LDHRGRRRLCGRDHGRQHGAARVPAYTPIKNVLVEASTWGLLLAMRLV
jgi:hypothetical protein